MTKHKLSDSPMPVDCVFYWGLRLEHESLALEKGKSNDEFSEAALQANEKSIAMESRY